MDSSFYWDNLLNSAFNTVTFLISGKYRKYYNSFTVEDFRNFSNNMIVIVDWFLKKRHLYYHY